MGGGVRGSHPAHLGGRCAAPAPGLAPGPSPRRMKGGGCTPRLRNRPGREVRSGLCPACARCEAPAVPGVCRGGPPAAVPGQSRGGPDSAPEVLGEGRLPCGDESVENRRVSEVRASKQQAECQEVTAEVLAGGLFSGGRGSAACLWLGVL